MIRIEAGYKGFVSKDEMYTMLPAFYKEMKEELEKIKEQLLNVL